MRKIRVLISTLGMDQHEVGAIIVARMLRDAGMEVIYISKLNLPDRIVRASLQEDVDVIGLSCHSWEYLHYIPELLNLLKENKANIPVVVGGSVITPKDQQKLLEMGVLASFGPGAEKDCIINKIRELAGQPKDAVFN